MKTNQNNPSVSHTSILHIGKYHVFLMQIPVNFLKNYEENGDFMLIFNKIQNNVVGTVSQAVTGM
jgi:hypothetical protein